MELEHFLSGYCRTLDESRTVAVITEDDQLTEVDCCYENCIHKPSCTIAKEIDLLMKIK